jgi:hypothetical protein
MKHRLESQFGVYNVWPMSIHVSCVSSLCTFDPCLYVFPMSVLCPMSVALSHICMCIPWLYGCPMSICVSCVCRHAPCLYVCPVSLGDWLRCINSLQLVRCCSGELQHGIIFCTYMSRVFMCVPCLYIQYMHICPVSLHVSHVYTYMSSVYMYVLYVCPVSLCMSHVFTYVPCPYVCPIKT